MSFDDLRVVYEKVDLDDYLKLYNYVRENMEHQEWLGTFERIEIEDILLNGGKIWLYYNNDDLVCSMFYIPVGNKSLRKHNVNYDEEVTGSLGPIMVSPDYVGNGFQFKMMGVFDDYCRKIGKKYVYTKAHSDNIYSINNMIKDGYVLVDKYENERGSVSAFLKEL